MTYNELKSQLPPDFDPVQIWDDWQDPVDATAESLYIYAEDGDLQIVWIVNSMEAFVELMSALLFKETYPDGLEFYDVDDPEILEELAKKVELYRQLHSETWNFEKCRQFIHKDLSDALTEFEFSVCELGKVSDLLNVSEDELDLCKDKSFEDYLETPSAWLSDSQFSILSHYEGEEAPADDKNSFLKFLSSTVVLGY